jgi:hypothetical protein
MIRRLGDGFPAYFQKYENELRKIRDEAVKRTVEKSGALAFIRMKETEVLEVADLSGMGREEVINCTKKYVEQIEAIAPPAQGTAPEPAPDTQAPVLVSKKTINATLDWLRKKQYAIHFIEESQPISTNDGGIVFTLRKDEWRITKTVAYIYRKLVSAVKMKEIPLTESEVSGFMINYLRKDGNEITKNATDKAAKSCQKPPKSA